MKYVIRPMAEGDIDRVLELEREIFTDDAWRRVDFEFTVEESDEYPLVVETDEGIAAYSAMSYIAGECEIGNIAVAAGYRKNGLGRALMDSMLSRAQELGASKVMLEVREGNLPARSLYDSYGFVKVGSRKEYYRNPTEDAILMDLVLEHNRKDI